jgi:hypothetical protein
VKARREPGVLPAECEAQITAAASGMVTPGLEGLVTRLHAQADREAVEALNPSTYFEVKRGRRAPAIPMPVDEPPKKRGRR